MITRGIVEKIYDKNSIAVRIPIFDSSATASDRTPTDSLGVASICTLPNSIPNVRIGDVVYVGFENDDISQPVILGYVYIDSEYSTRQGLSLQSLDVVSSAKLPKETIIGDVSSKEVLMLSGIKQNIQEQIDGLKDYVDDSIIRALNTPV